MRRARQFVARIVCIVMAGRTSVIRGQGLVFTAAALLLSGYHLVIGLPDGARLLPWLAVSIILLGVPHGALDTLYAGRAFGIRHAGHWWLFSMAYFLPVVAVLCLWPYGPGLFLLLFLTVSVAHFSGDRGQECPLWLRLIYGGSPVVLPALRYVDEVERLFAALVPSEIASSFAAVLGFLAWPWLLALGFGVVRSARHYREGALEIAAAGMLCAVVPPLAAFTLFFCGMHSARHILRSLPAGRGAAGWGRFIGAGAMPMVATLALLAFYWESAAGIEMEPRLVQTVFVGLAALTFPHVVLVDWLYGWRGASAGAAGEDRPVLR